MLPLLASGAPSLALLLGGAYAAAGLTVAGLLAHRGQPPSTSAAALVAWPLLIELLAPAPLAPAATGPLAPQIARAFDALARALAENAGAEEALPADLSALRRAVEQADGRLARVDRLLAEEDAVHSDALLATRLRLREARRHAEAEIEAVLAEVLQLRIQVGLLALAGEGRPVRERLAELRGRVRALDEVHGMIGGPLD